MIRVRDALVLNNKEWKSFADSGDAGIWKAEDQDHYKVTESVIEELDKVLEQPNTEHMRSTVNEKQLLRQYARITELEAARYAYASEFPPNEDGEPDKGSIHQNIRALKAENALLRADAARYAYVSQATTSTTT